MPELSSLPRAHASRTLQVHTSHRLKGYPVERFLSPDGKHFAFMDGLLQARIDVVDFASGRSVEGFPRKVAADADAQWSPQGKRLLYKEKHGVRCADVESGATVALSNITRASEATFSPDEAHLAWIENYNTKSGLGGYFDPNYRGRLHIVDATHGGLEHSYELGAGQGWLKPAYLADGRQVATCVDSGLTVVNLDSGEVRHSALPGHLFFLHPMGPDVVVGSPSEFYVVDGSSLQVRDTYQGQSHTLAVQGDIAAVRDPKGKGYVIDLNKRKTLYTFDEPGKFALSPRGAQLALAIQNSYMSDSSVAPVQVMDGRGAILATTKDRGYLAPAFTRDGSKVQWHTMAGEPLEVHQIDVPEAES